MTSRFNDYMTGEEFDVSSLHTPWGQFNGPDQGVSPQQLAPSHVQCMSDYMPQPSPIHDPYPYHPNYPCPPYHAYTDQYVQQCTTQHMAPMLSPAENRVLVSDGSSWRVYDLENVFSG